MLSGRLLLAFAYYVIIPIITCISGFAYLFGFYLFQFYINSILIKAVYRIFIMTRIFQAGSSASIFQKPNCREKFKSGPGGHKYKIWSNHNFLCSNNNYQCTKAKCDQGMKQKIEYGVNDLWFKNGTLLGEGGFAKVYESDWHGNNAAYKKIPITIGNDPKLIGPPTKKDYQHRKERAIKEAFEEYDIMENISKKPKDGDKMLYKKYWETHYEEGMEEYIIKPFGYFFVEEVSTQNIWIVIITPKMKLDLEKLKRTGKLNEDNVRVILEQLNNAMNYLYKVREIRHQDIKPNNILVSYDERNNVISNIKVINTFINKIIIN